MHCPFPQAASPAHGVVEKPLGIFQKKSVNVCLFLREKERETEHEWGEGQRERETQNLKQAPGSELSAQKPTRSSGSPTVRS